MLARSLVPARDIEMLVGARLSHIEAKLKAREVLLEARRKQKLAVERAKSSAPKRLGKLRYEAPDTPFLLTEELPNSMRTLAVRRAACWLCCLSLAVRQLIHRAHSNAAARKPRHRAVQAHAAQEPHRTASASHVRAPRSLSLSLSRTRSLGRGALVAAKDAAIPRSSRSATRRETEAAVRRVCRSSSVSYSLQGPRGLARLVLATCVLARSLVRSPHSFDPIAQ